MEETEDPKAGLASTQNKLGEVAASALNNKVSLSDFIDKMTAYAMLTSLPPSYGTLASALLANGSNINAYQVIAAAPAKHRRRIMPTEEVDSQGFLARKDESRKTAGQGKDRRRLDLDGRPLVGRDAGKFCGNHK